jgi:hypothetical protein
MQNCPRTSTSNVVNCGSLGLALQHALDDIRQDDSLPYLSDDQADNILEALGAAVTKTKTTERESDLTFSSSSNSPLLTATVDYYNRMGDKWRIVAASAELHLPCQDHSAGKTSISNQTNFEGSRTQRKRKTLSEPIKLQALEVLVYTDD